MKKALNPTRVALMAGAITLIVFSIGIWFGLTMQDQRVEEIKNDYLQIQILWNDVELQSEILEKNSISNEKVCENAVNQNLDFGEQVYEKGKKIETYEQRNEFSDTLKIQKKEHNLLKLQFWLNSMNIQEKCSNAEYINVVYFYKDDPSNLEEEKQNKISGVLFDLKQENGQKIMLIPIASDLGLSSVQTMISKYAVNEFPAVLINENILVNDVKSKQELQKIIDEEIIF